MQRQYQLLNPVRLKQTGGAWSATTCRLEPWKTMRWMVRQVA